MKKPNSLRGPDGDALMSRWAGSQPQTLRMADGGMISALQASLNRLVGNNPAAMAVRGRSADADTPRAPVTPPTPPAQPGGTVTPENPAGLRFADGGGYVSVMDRVPDMANPTYRAHLEQQQALEGSHPELLLGQGMRAGIQAVKETRALMAARQAAAQVPEGMIGQNADHFFNYSTFPPPPSATQNTAEAGVHAIAKGISNARAAFGWNFGANNDAPSAGPKVGLRDGGAPRMTGSGTVPGSGSGDKIPAKYTPGEFVVSNAMLDAAPQLRGQLNSLRNNVLAAQGKNVADVDAKAAGGGLRLASGGPQEDADGYLPNEGIGARLLRRLTPSTGGAPLEMGAPNLAGMPAQPAGAGRGYINPAMVKPDDTQTQPTIAPAPAATSSVAAAPSASPAADPQKPLSGQFGAPGDAPATSYFPAGSAGAASLGQKVDSAAYVPTPGTGLLRNNSTGAVTQFNGRAAAPQAPMSASLAQRIYGPTDYSPGRNGDVPDQQTSPSLRGQGGAPSDFFGQLMNAANTIGAHRGARLAAYRDAQLHIADQTNQTNLRGQNMQMDVAMAPARYAAQQRAMAADLLNSVGGDYGKAMKLALRSGVDPTHLQAAMTADASYKTANQNLQVQSNEATAKAASEALARARQLHTTTVDGKSVVDEAGANQSMQGLQTMLTGQIADRERAGDTAGAENMRRLGIAAISPDMQQKGVLATQLMNKVNADASNINYFKPDFLKSSDPRDYLDLKRNASGDWVTRKGQVIPDRYLAKLNADRWGGQPINSYDQLKAPQ